MTEAAGPLRVMVIFGTRPEVIKLAPVIAALREHPSYFATTVVVTAQHRSMMDQMLEVFGIQPDRDLNIMEENQSLARVTCNALQRLDGVLAEYAPQVIIVQGDTTTTFVAALCGYYHKVAVAHVEAGLRTGRKYSPFPEEINRRLTSALAELHFAPTPLAKENLLREGVEPENIFVTGNTVVDAVQSIVAEPPHFRDARLAALMQNGLRTVAITAHRRENWGPALENIAEAVLRLASLCEDVQFVFPVHLNPNVRAVFKRRLRGHPRIHLLEPLDYRSFVHLLGRSVLILTDSGGIQEEAPSLRKPVLVMREVTERPEGLASGWLKLVGCDVERIVSEAQRLLEDSALYSLAISAPNPYGDGKAAQRIIEALCFHFGLSDRRPEEFQPGA
ncbi:MAG: UDP-N-acetylglucosamine 2-epimerase (non-hydrolyzing) [candidate division KSB1 bacterium]|nr:UDP-N-acetylglucosamine 2-epimerase (non-hydrolyzing) [candidate division KSB1 bacterium]MDZ7296117.1 UDP-N-acetylglucosamine 2-epimerase (non-hydrolyzing) [candidate division KSB1 bacterium]MDZ7413302.1 UDP-N-acetylglucosamine 2-epimerase (non-hydrolyzing) [candidate division KSB1 bacterium]